MESKDKKVTELADLMFFRQSDETQNIFKALLNFNKKFKGVTKDKFIERGGKKQNYATLDAILKEIRPLLAEEGVFVLQPLSGKYIVTRLQHTSGEFIESAVQFRAMDNQRVNNLQKIGGGYTYMKRYSLTSILGISTDDDLDAEHQDDPTPPKTEKRRTPPKIEPPTNKQTEAIRSLIEAIESNLDQLSEKQRKEFDHRRTELNNHRTNGTLSKAIAGKAQARLTLIVSSLK